MKMKIRKCLTHLLPRDACNNMSKKKAINKMLALYFFHPQKIKLYIVKLEPCYLCLQEVSISFLIIARLAGLFLVDHISRVIVM